MLLSDIITALFNQDRELRREVLCAVADAAQERFRGLAESLKEKYRWARNFFWISVLATVVAALWWMLGRAIGIKTELWYQIAILLPALLWVSFLSFAMVCFSLLKTLGVQYQSIRNFIEEAEIEVRANLRLPASLALVALVFSGLIGRFPSLREPGNFITLVGIVVAFALMSFLGLVSLPFKWLQGFILMLAALVVLLIFVVPQMPPELTAVIEKGTERVKTEVAMWAKPERVNIDPENPPPFFRQPHGEPLIWYSIGPAGNVRFWNGKGRDPDTKDSLMPVETPQRRKELLRLLEAHTKATQPPVSPQSGRKPNALNILSGDQIEFVDPVTGTNKIWYFQGENGGFELYDGPGFHRSGVGLRPADTAEVRGEITKWFAQKQAEGPKDEKPPEPPKQFVDNQLPERQDNAERITGNATQDVLTAPPRPPSPEQVVYSSSACRTIAEEFLGIEESVFLKFFTLDCTRVSFEQPVTVKATFRLARPSNQTGTASWTRLFNVVEKFTPVEYCGFTDTKTVERVVASLRKQIEGEPQVMMLIRSTVH